MRRPLVGRARPGALPRVCVLCYSLRPPSRKASSHGDLNSEYSRVTSRSRTRPTHGRTPQPSHLLQGTRRGPLPRPRAALEESAPRRPPAASRGAHFRPRGRSGVSANQRRRRPGASALALLRRFESPPLRLAVAAPHSGRSAPPRPRVPLRPAPPRGSRRPPSRRGRLRLRPSSRPMSKRRAAEPLALHVPWKRLLLCGFPEEPPPLLWTPPSGAARPRKRRIDAGAMAELPASPNKRRGRADGDEPQSRGPDPGETPPPPPAQPSAPGEEPRHGRPRTDGGDDGAQGPPRGAWGAAVHQYNEEFWQYNTFQYWRNPLPPIDLADIQGVSEDSLTETTLQDKNGVAEIDMES